MSAHPGAHHGLHRAGRHRGQPVGGTGADGHAPSRRILAAVAAQVSGFLLEPPRSVEEDARAAPASRPAPGELRSQPVVAVVSAAPRSGCTTVARALATELAARTGGVAIVSGSAGRGSALPSRAASRVAASLAGMGEGRIRAAGRLCLVPGADAEVLASGGRYLAPVVLDVPPDGSAVAAARGADHVVVVASAEQDPALGAALAQLLGPGTLRVVNRAPAEGGAWAGRADVEIAESRLGARMAMAGVRPHGAIRRTASELAEALGLRALDSAEFLPVPA